jgi:hypothetical protein
MLVYDVEIAIVYAMFFRACVVYNNNFAVFIDIIVFLTIEALSQNAIFDESFTLFHFKDFQQFFE